MQKNKTRGKLSIFLEVILFKLSVAPTPVVTSTTSKDCSSENKKTASKSI